MKNNQDDLIRKNQRTGLMVFGLVVAMVMLAFASVPMYDLFCRVTGFGGTPQTSARLPDTILDRQITVKFNADIHRNLLWDFKPEMREITVNIGQRGVTAYSAKNLTQRPLSGTAVYNVTPLKVGQYFHKIQCFCFDEQTLNGGEAVSMPVLFYVDPALADDPSMDDVTTITLSYNFFKAKTKELDEAMEDFYYSDN